MARRLAACLDDDRAHLPAVSLRTGLAVKAPPGIPEIIAPAFPLEFPPQTMSLEQSFLSASAFHPHGVMPRRCLKDAGRHLQAIPISGHGSQQCALLNRLKVAGCGNGIAIVDGLKALGFVERHRSPFF
ncbi:hypothetical protein [Sphingobium sp. TomTYG45]